MQLQALHQFHALLSIPPCFRITTERTLDSDYNAKISMHYDSYAVIGLLQKGIL